MTDLQDLYRETMYLAHAPGLSDETVEEINDQWEAFHQGLDVTDPTNFGPFLVRFIADRYQNTPSDKRSEQLCGSGNRLCEVRRGNVPTALKPERGRFREVGLTPSRARQYIADHPKCHVVSDGLQAFQEAQQEARRQLMRIQATAMQDNQPQMDADNIPTQQEVPTGDD